MKRIATLFLAVLLLAACQDRGPTVPEPEPEFELMAAASGIAYVQYDEASFVIEYPVDITGVVSNAEFDAPVCHWDEDEIEDPSHVI